MYVPEDNQSTHEINELFGQLHSMHELGKRHVKPEYVRDIVSNESEILMKAMTNATLKRYPHSDTSGDLVPGDRPFISALPHTSFYQNQQRGLIFQTVHGVDTHGAAFRGDNLATTLHTPEDTILPAYRLRLTRISALGSLGTMRILDHKESHYFALEANRILKIADVVLHTADVAEPTDDTPDTRRANFLVITSEPEDPDQR